MGNGHGFGDRVYCLTEKFPTSERFGLIAQIRRCAVSIPSNIAEGSRRKTQADFCHFLHISFGSGAELETQLEISRRLKYATEPKIVECSKKLESVMRMLNNFIQTLD